MLIEHRPCLLN
jgi:hypothetical protein